MRGSHVISFGAAICYVHTSCSLWSTGFACPFIKWKRSVCDILCGRQYLRRLTNIALVPLVILSKCTLWTEWLV